MISDDDCDESCFCRKPLNLESFGDTPPRTTRWVRFKGWLGL